MLEKLGKSELGYGIYTIPDISFLLGFPQEKVRRYVKNFWDEKLGKKLFNQTYSWQNEKTKAVNFFVLIEMYTFFRLQEMGVKTNKILKAHDVIAKELNTPYPFANQSLLSDGNNILYEFNNLIINADGTRQTNIRNIIRLFCEKIDFGNDDLAKRYYPIGKKRSVVVDPHHQFGQPVIVGTNINTEVIFEMIDSGESINTLSQLYSVPKTAISDILFFYKKHSA